MRRELWWLLIALASIGFAVWLYFSLERYETEVYKPQSGEAIKNPFLAAQRYLKQRGVDVKEQQERLDFDKISYDDIVVVAQADALLVSESQIEKAVSWVQKGGFLIVGVGDEIEGHASILKHYGIEVEEQSFNLANILVGEDGDSLTEQETEEEINRRLNQSSDGQDSEDNDGARLVAEDDSVRSLFRLLNLEFEHSFYPIELSDLDDTLYMAVLDGIVLDHADFYEDEYSEYDDSDDFEQDQEQVEHHSYFIQGEISDESGSRLIQIKDGLGSITALSSTSLWRNKNIGLGDHARLLSYFVPDDSNVYLVFNVQAPTLSELAQRYTKEATLGLCLFVLFWLWRVATRVLKQTEVQPRLGREFAEHLKAGAKFMAMHRQYQPILDSLNDDIELQMRRYHFGFTGFSTAEKASLIHQQTSLAEDVYIQWATLRDQPNNEYEFVQALKLGQAIRKKL